MAERLRYGAGTEGVIDAIPKEMAEKIYDCVRNTPQPCLIGGYKKEMAEKIYDCVREKINIAKDKKNMPAKSSADENPITILKARYARGISQRVNSKR